MASIASATELSSRAWTISKSSHITSGSQTPIAGMPLAGGELHTGISLSRVDLYRGEALDEGLIGPAIAAGGWP